MKISELETKNTTLERNIELQKTIIANQKQVIDKNTSKSGKGKEIKNKNKQDALWSNSITYVIKEGDTLTKLAEICNCTPEEILKKNNTRTESIDKEGKLREGKTIYLPCDPDKQ
jgi:uncharacterized protein (DUF2344 family)